MRRIATTSAIVFFVVLTALADTSVGRGRTARATARRHVESDGKTNESQCDTPRGITAYGSSARCLRALCADHNVINAYVLDHAHRLQRNPCAGLDPFDLRH